MGINLKKLQLLFEQEDNITHAAKEYCRVEGKEYSDSFRRRCSKLLNSFKSSVVDDDLENESSTETQGYEKVSPFMPSAWDFELNRFLSIEEFCKKYGLDVNTVKSSKLISHNQSHITYNIAFYTPEEEAINNIQDGLEDIVKKYITPLAITPITSISNSSEWFDRLVYTDVHIAMDVNGDGDPLYDGKWDKEEVLKRLALMVSHVLSYKKSDTLVIDDLGDFLDGLGGETTRKGHALPQNMNDKEAFDLALQFKISLVDSLVGHYKLIICNNITNDNHAGVFSYFANSAFKQICEQKYPENVQINNVKRFMHNYSIGKHTFIISHGKDIGEQRFGFKPILDSKQADKIDQYCKEHKLYGNNFIEFSKGDSHQAIYDDTTSNDFQYYSYPAFSPPSNWVKTNFKLSKSGLVFYNIHKEENIKISIPYWF